MTMKHNNSKPLGCSKSSSKQEVYSNTTLPQETREIWKREHNFTPKTTGKRTKNPQISRRDNIQAEINEEEMKEIRIEINKTKS